ncbi:MULTISPECIES: DUF6167 family protein [Actinomadura]|jgi:hypothetical protein|uniref:Secreted protein n=1 Tax=Actinomadura keratinilytica TaxID=547461 RepID=A0ABP7Y1Q4_9ACTN|nr:DUF6167 family protein [Actinomadura sp. NBRC 104425]GLZ10908.1 hypothetical protein Acsp04_11430 [Actinomadura sp. NBRC 104425]
MKRLFWLSVGAGAGIYASHRVRRRMERLVRTWSPEGVAARAVTAGHDMGDRLRHFADDVRREMRNREAELREAVQIDTVPIDPGPDPTRRRRVLKARYTIIDDDKDGH